MEDCRSYSNRLVVQRVHERNAKRVIVAKGGLREGDTEQDIEVVLQGISWRSFVDGDA
jgi:hypothetical protein